MNTVKSAYTIFAPKKPDNGILKVRVKFTDTGNIYDIVLVEKDVAISLVDSSDLNFLGIPGLVLVDEASMEKVKSILRDLIENGFFDGLAPING